MAKSLRLWSLALVTVLIAAVLVAIPYLDRDADAADASDFDAGYIISDENFYNGSAMTSASQVQSFLESKNPGCKTGQTCILNYTEPTPTMAASLYCDRLEGRDNESAASIIQRVGEACNISQEALIVLIEKEQSLVSLQNPAPWRFESATGYGCPDTAPCDAGFGGFFTQMYYGARAYQYYKEHPTQFRHQPNAWNSVLYNPSSSCGSSQVFIQNYATAGLYNYTPYQPNQAAMNNLYGTGDTCSSYGNRNFWRMYTDWFGDPTGSSLGTGDVVQSTSTGHYFVFSESDGLVRIPERPQLVSMGLHHNVRQMAPTQIYEYGLSSTQVRGWGLRCGNANYLASSGLLQHFESAATRDHYGVPFTALPADLCGVLPKAKDKVSQVAIDEAGGLWLIENGVKRAATEGALEAVGLDDKYRITLPRLFAETMPTGDAFTGVDATTGDVLRDTDNGDYFIYSEDAGMIEVTDRAFLVSMGRAGDIRNVGSSVIAAHGLASQTLDSWAIQCNGQSYFASSRVLQPFESAAVQSHYGMTPTQLPADLCETLTFSENEVSQVASDLSDDLWVIENGEKRAATQASLEAADLDDKFRVTLPPRYINSLTQGSDHTAPDTPAAEATVGDVIQDAASGEQYVYSAQQGLLPVADSVYLEALGIDTAATRMSASEIASLGLSSNEISGWGFVCGSTQYVASGGELFSFESNETREHFDMSFTELPADLCEALAFSDHRASQLVTDGDGKFWFMEHGEKRPVELATLQNGDLPTKYRLVLPSGLLDSFPVGESYIIPSYGVLESGQVVIGDSDDRYIFSADAGLVPVADEAILVSLGLQQTPVALSDSDLDDVGTHDTTLDSWLVTCSDEVFFASSQQVHPVAEGALEHLAMNPVELPADLCGLLTVSDVQATQVMTDMSGRLWVLEDGALRAATEGTLEDAGLQNLERVTMPDAYMRVMPVWMNLELDDFVLMEVPPAP
ncbi:hypothetical protein [uncultured Agrococcus sp.]|uniref:hypothetical protein n=1 Tax=uncultured Agrococcus sp. TaxID=382258 RepID=UPI0025D61293|nr:hypothetical protein [uncultured Agrococcus sp.]